MTLEERKDKILDEMYHDFFYGNWNPSNIKGVNNTFRILRDYFKIKQEEDENGD